MNKFRVELRNKDFVLDEILDLEYQDLSWSYSRIGGCGEFSFRLPRQRFEGGPLTGESNIRIYYRNPDTNVYDLWYQGLIENKIPIVQGDGEEIQVSGHGYQTQLERVYLDNVTYTSQEASVIVTDILDTYITPNTNVSYDAADIETTPFTFSSLEFNEDCLSALTKIADTVGAMEWGVNKDRKFFFKKRSSDIGESFRFPPGKITNFEDNQDFTEIVNRVLVQGAQSGGTYHKFGPYDDAPSQLKYNLRVENVQNSSITTAADAQQIATSVLEENRDVTRKASCELVRFDGLVESTIPIPLFAEISRRTKYGQKKYGTFRYSGIVGRQIERANYNYTSGGNLTIRLDLGKLRPIIAEEISQLKYNLDQNRSAAL